MSFTLPALAAAALRGQEEAPADLDADRADGLPTDEPDPEHLRENGRPLHGAVRRTNRAPGLADSRERSWPGLRTALLRLGNSIAILLLLAVFVGGANALVRRYEFNPASMQYASAGARAHAAAAAARPRTRRWRRGRPTARRRPPFRAAAAPP